MDVFESFQNFYRIQLGELSRGLSFISVDSIREAVELIDRCRGKIVFTGVGKSGNIAAKLAATFASTGTPAFFLHPCDAVHGDLGAVSPDDVLVALGKSGESTELLAMLQVVKKFGTPIISILGEPSSSTAKLSTVVIHAPVSREADELNLAPTSSTTLSLVIGDALALTLSRLRRFGPEDFGRYHPGGQLGRRLLLKVEDLLITDRGVPIARFDTDIKALLEAETGPNLGGVMIIDENEKLIGLVTDGDIRRAIVRFGNVLECSISEIMTRDPITVPSYMMAIDALKVMENRPSQISVLPVVDESARPVGLLRLHDIVRAGLGGNSG